MANHGYCKNCWWCKIIVEHQYRWDNEGRLHKNETGGEGRCYMHNDSSHPWTDVKLTSYCPDYTNRNKQEKKWGTLEESMEHW